MSIELVMTVGRALFRSLIHRYIASTLLLVPAQLKKSGQSLQARLCGCPSIIFARWREPKQRVQVTVTQSHGQSLLEHG